MKALMASPLTFSLLCDKNRLFRAKRIAGSPYFRKPTERKILPLADSLKYFAAMAAMNIFSQNMS